MQPEELYSKIIELGEKVKNFSSAVNISIINSRIEEIDRISIDDPGFWSKPESKTLLKEQAKYKKLASEWDTLNRLKDDCFTLWELYKEDDDSSLLDELAAATAEFEKAVSDFELKLMLNGEQDGNNAIITIHSGAGGTESNDWAAMLFRMYSMWAESMGYKLELFDMLDGDEAGIKSVTFSIAGDYVYGYLKGETGVHRLVRISPFDSQSRRHTSFASVFVLPEVDDNIDIVINEADLRIDTYRAGGAGGQHVNTTDSAVRITHIPTGIVVSCQTERSQHQNKEHAMKVLMARLYEHEMNKLNTEKDKLESSKSDIGWGNQIRSYVLHPYKMVKDLRTRYETGNTDSVLNGGLEPFIKAYLLHNAGILTTE